ncbi:MAG TPA: DUF2306 domain-containing protein [Bryobacteraceae bacterium]|nr:DUF2306 domain-containing protein [Bryobacteraceae bacterium]
MPHSAAADPVARKAARLRSISWAILTFFALGTGLGALRYALPRVPFPAPLPNFFARHGWLVGHAVSSGVALLAGPWQFLSSLRRRSLSFHRWAGRVYCAAVLAGWLLSLPIAAHAQTGRVASAGFLTLGAAWIAATAAGYFNARRGLVLRHREWMTRSYALTAAAITLRIYLPIMTMAGVPFSTSYPLVAWICWIPNLLFAEWLVRRPAFGRSRLDGFQN